MNQRKNFVWDCFRPVLSIAAIAATLAIPGVVHAQYTSSNRDILVPNTDAWPSGGVTLGGTSFINLGLQGVGRVAVVSVACAAAGSDAGSTALFAFA